MSFNAQLNPLKMFWEKKIQQIIQHKNVLKQQAHKTILFYNAVFQWGQDRIAGIATAIRGWPED